MYFWKFDIFFSYLLGGKEANQNSSPITWPLVSIRRNPTKTHNHFVNHGLGRLFLPFAYFMVQRPAFLWLYLCRQLKKDVLYVQMTSFKSAISIRLFLIAHFHHHHRDLLKKSSRRSKVLQEKSTRIWCSHAAKQVFLWRGIGRLVAQRSRERQIYRHSNKQKHLPRWK